MRRVAACVAAAASALVACSFVNSLGYLTNGNGVATDAGVGDGDTPVPPTILARDQGAPESLLVDDSNVYWHDKIDGAIMLLAKTGPAGTTPKQLGTTGAQSAALAIDRTGDLYWAGQRDGTIHRITKAGVDVAIAQGETSPVDIEVDDRFVYWADADPNTTNSAVVRLAKTGGQKEVLTTTEIQADPQALALDAANIYWFDSDGLIYQIPKSTDGGVMGVTYGTTANTIANPGSLALDTLAFFLADSESYAVTKVLRSAPPNTDALVLAALDERTTPHAIVLDDKYVYWTSFVGGTVSRVSKGAGGDAKLLAKGQIAPEAIAVDAQSVYWTTVGSGGRDGMVLRIPKP